MCNPENLTYKIAIRINVRKVHSILCLDGDIIESKRELLENTTSTKRVRAACNRIATSEIHWTWQEYTYIHVWKHTNVHAAHFLHLSPADNKFGFEARKKVFRVLLLKVAFKKLDGWVLKYTLYVLCRCLSTILLKQSSMLTPCWDFMREVKKKRERGKRLSKFLGDYSDGKRKGKARKVTLELHLRRSRLI